MGGKVDEQTVPQVERFEVTAHLSEMDVVQGFDCFQFDDKLFRHQEIDPVEPHLLTAVENRHFLLKLG